MYMKAVSSEHSNMNYPNNGLDLPTLHLTAFPFYYTCLRIALTSFPIELFLLTPSLYLAEHPALTKIGQPPVSMYQPNMNQQVRKIRSK